MLPKSKVPGTLSKLKKVRSKSSNETAAPPSILDPITAFPKSVHLRLAKGNERETQWNSLINTYHYLGHKVVVGRCLKYIVEADDRIVGAICFSSSAWHLSSRNALLKQFIGEEEIRDLVINNSRFLILPNIQVPNLASHILALATRQVSQDWQQYYSIVPLFVETFVEPTRFLGTCYKAANWQEIGLTKGYAKNGASFHNSQQPKQIFIYALSKKLRKELEAAISASHGNKH